MQVSSSATMRGDLADVLKEQKYGEGEFIGLYGMPVMNAGRKSGTFAKIDFVAAATESLTRAPGAGYSRVRREATTDTYTCVEYGREEPIDDGEAADLANYFDAEVDAAMAGQGTIMRRQEVAIAAILFDDSSVFGSYKTDGSDWSTAASGTPINDVRTAINALKVQIDGAVGNARIVALCHDTVLDYALNCTDTANRLNYGGMGMSDRDVAKAALARAMGLNEIHATSIQIDGSAIWATTKFGIYLVGNGRDIRSTPQVGRSVLWTEDCPENALVETYRDETVRSDIVRVRQHIDEKLLTARAGHILYGLTS